jgi:hypothetical protein
MALREVAGPRDHADFGAFVTRARCRAMNPPFPDAACRLRTGVADSKLKGLIIAATFITE